MSPDGPGPGRVALVALVLTGFLLAIGVFVGAVTGIDESAAVIGTAVAALVALLLLRLVGSGDGGDVWEPIPGTQYAGRVVQGGGPTRAEQEEAVEEVQERADEIDDADDGRES
jgi:protein-S-isoprenylcysteine O-methyltransferase Ste14